MAQQQRGSISSVNARWARCVADAMQRADMADEQSAERLRDALLGLPRSILVENATPTIDDDVEYAVGYGCVLPRVSVATRLLGLLGVERGQRVLDIDCGAGFATAVMTRLGARVYALEPIGLLGQRTRRVLDAIGCPEVLVRTMDGHRGWKEYAPFDRILLSSPVAAVPDPVLKQLSASGGRCVAVVGTGMDQRLVVFERRGGTPRQYALEEGYFLSPRGAEAIEGQHAAVPRYAAERKVPVMPTVPRDGEW